MKKVPKTIDPYPTSWINRFIGWVDDFPVPPWMLYSGLFLLHGLINHLVNWQEGFVQSGTLDISLFLIIVQPYGILVLHQYLESASRVALRDTRPILGVTDDEFHKLEYEFRFIPARPFTAWSVVGLVVGVYFFFDQEPSGIGLFYGIVTLFFINVFNGMLAFGFVYRTFRILRMINSLFASAPNVGLFMLFSVYALSTLSAKIGVSALLLLYISNFATGGEVPDLALGLIIIGSSVPLAAFFLPLININQRLVDEKRRLLFDVSQRLEFVLGQIKRSVESGDLKKTGDLEPALRTLRSENELIENIPTWPWEPATLRVVLSAVFVPILLWLIQQILDRFLDF
jgi:hypothetical protein